MRPSVRREGVEGVVGRTTRQFLEAKDEGVIVISTVHPTHFDTVVEVEGNTVRMTEPPENLIVEG